MQRPGPRRCDRAVPETGAPEAHEPLGATIRRIRPAASTRRPEPLPGRLHDDSDGRLDTSSRCAASSWWSTATTSPSAAGELPSLVEQRDRLLDRLVRLPASTRAEVWVVFDGTQAGRGRAVEGSARRVLFHAGGHDRRRADPTHLVPTVPRERPVVVASSDLRGRGRRAPPRRQRDLCRAAARTPAEHGRQLTRARTARRHRSAQECGRLWPVLRCRFRSRGSRFVSIPVRDWRGMVRRSRERPAGTGRTGVSHPVHTARMATFTISCDDVHHARHRGMRRLCRDVPVRSPRAQRGRRSTSRRPAPFGSSARPSLVPPLRHATR